MSAKLAAQIEAVNRANKYATDLHPVLNDVFRPFLGEKIITNDGRIAKRVEQHLPELPCTTTLQVLSRITDYTLAFVVKTSVNVAGQKICVYHETVIYVAYMRYGGLKELRPPELYRSDYTVEGIEAGRRECQVVKKRLDELQSSLFPFGENSY